MGHYDCSRCHQYGCTDNECMSPQTIALAKITDKINDHNRNARQVNIEILELEKKSKLLKNHVELIQEAVSGLNAEYTKTKESYKTIKDV